MKKPTYRDGFNAGLEIAAAWLDENADGLEGDAYILLKTQRQDALRASATAKKSRYYAAKIRELKRE